MMATLGWLARLGGAAIRTLASRLLGRRKVPNWSLRTELVHATTRATLDSSLLYGVDWFRNVQERSARPGLLAKARETREESLGGVPGVWFEPTVQKPERTLLYLHGGGYVFSSPRVYDDLCSRLAVGASARVFCPDYRKAPEDPLPAAFDDCASVYRALVEVTGNEKEPLVLAGDSAGGCLALATCRFAREQGLALPQRLLLLSPWVDPRRRGGSIAANAGTDIGPPEWLTLCADRALPEDWEVDGVLSDPRVAPLGSDLSRFPACLVQVGGREMLLDQVRELVECLRSSGVSVELEEEPDMFHVWQLMAGSLPQGEAAVESACRFLRLTSAGD